MSDNKEADVSGVLRFQAFDYPALPQVEFDLASAWFIVESLTELSECSDRVRNKIVSMLNSL